MGQNQVNPPHLPPPPFSSRPDLPKLWLDIRTSKRSPLKGVLLLKIIWEH